MPDVSVEFALRFADYVGLCLFALSGALTAAQLRQTPVTFAFFAAITGVGGGTIRDLLIGQPVFWVNDPVPLILCLAMAAVVWVSDASHWPERSLLWLDAVGLSAYGAFGAIKALAVGVAPVVAISMGVFTAAFGGVIRDMLAHKPSVIIGPEIYITAAALAASVTIVLILAGLTGLWAGAIGALLGFTLRACALRRGWKLPHYRSGNVEKVK